MSLYKGGKSIKSIRDLTEGLNYCIGSFGGVLKIEKNKDGERCYVFRAQKEGVAIFLDENALLDRIKLRIVKRVLAQVVPKQTTLERLLKK